MPHRRSTIWLALVALLLVSGGGNCNRMAWQVSQTPPPVVFSANPTLADVIAVVNANRTRAVSISSTQATLSGTGFPSMRTNLAIGSPRHLRMRAGTGLTGSELDLGSNDELFWLWIKRNQPPTTLVGRHDQFLNSAAGRTFPMRPEWLVEAVGLVYLDPNQPHTGPIRRADGRLEIHTPIETPAGRQAKVLVLDAQSGYVLEQHLLNEQGQVIASAINTRHFRDPMSGLVLPGDTAMSWPALGLSLRLELGEVRVNPVDLSPELWVKPQYPGYPEVDIAALSPPSGAMPGAGSAIQRPPAIEIPPMRPLTPVVPPPGL